MLPARLAVGEEPLAHRAQGPVDEDADDHDDDEHGVDVLVRPAPLRDRDEVAQPVLGVDELGQDDVAPADAVGQAQGVVDVAQGHRDHYPEHGLPAPRAQGVGGLQVDVVDLVQGADHQGQQDDEGGQGQEQDLLLLPQPEPGQGQRHQHRDGDVAADGAERLEELPHPREGAHEHSQGHRDRGGEQEAHGGAEHAVGDGRGQVPVQPQGPEGEHDLPGVGQDLGAQEPGLHLGPGGQQPPQADGDGHAEAAQEEAPPAEGLLPDLEPARAHPIPPRAGRP